MQQLIGRVIQASRSNIAKVTVERLMKEKPYLKPFKVTRNYFVVDESNIASVGDIVEIVYKGKGSNGICFKINQTVKEAQKYTNPINGKIYSVWSMVLSWISDPESSALRAGLLGCSYFDSDSNELLFASDKRCIIGVYQSSFYKVINSNVKQNHPKVENQVNSLRKSTRNCFFPTSLMQIYTNDSDVSLSKDTTLNLLAFIKTLQAQNQYYSIYPDFSNGGIVVDLLNEINIGPKKSALCLSDRLSIEFPHALRNIKAQSNAFIVASARSLRLYSFLNDSFSEVLEFSPHDEGLLSSVDICRTDLEICATVKDKKKLYVLGGNHRYEYNLNTDFSNCSYTSHPSLLALWGNSNTIELKDKRGSLASLSLFDQNVPISRVDNLISHASDNNLISISCTSSVKSHNASELRIYDIRYPKECTMRIASDKPINRLFHFDSFIDDRSDNIFGVDSDSNILRWEFRQSKNNREHVDGILTLTDVSKVSQKYPGNILNDSQIDFVGYAISPGFHGNESMFLMRLSSRGAIEYCTLDVSEPAPLPLDPNDIFEESGHILDFSCLYEEYSEGHQKLSNTTPLEISNTFGVCSQSTFHLDFYWDEIKSKICK